MEITDYLAYDNIILVQYPSNAGGKFLINCLGLSDQFVLQDNKLAELQIAGVLPSAKKFSILLDKLNSVTDEWNDLNLGCFRLFKQWQFPVRIELDPVIKLVIENKLFLCKIAHDGLTLQMLLTAWPNAKIIYFVNYKEFINRYRPFAARHNENYQIEIENIKSLSSKSVWVESFDADCYLDTASVIKEVSRIYRLLNLSDFNEEYITQYYKKWIEIISRIQNKTLTYPNN
jgi:hypothetical protein